MILLCIGANNFFTADNYISAHLGGKFEGKFWFFLFCSCSFLSTTFAGLAEINFTFSYIDAYSQLSALLDHRTPAEPSTLQKIPQAALTILLIGSALLQHLAMFGLMRGTEEYGLNYAGNNRYRIAIMSFAFISVIAIIVTAFAFLVTVVRMWRLLSTKKEKKLRSNECSMVIKALFGLLQIASACVSLVLLKH